MSDDDGVTWAPFENNDGRTLWGTYDSGSHADGACVHKGRIVRVTGSAFDREVWEIGRFDAPSPYILAAPRRDMSRRVRSPRLHEETVIERG
ncbi:MAG: hypothetical protein KF819_27170 [Labilithrix sp.]|nr:hypothetical protein [Labilithrix sp.]